MCANHVLRSPYILLPTVEKGEGPVTLMLSLTNAAVAVFSNNGDEAIHPQKRLRINGTSVSNKEACPDILFVSMSTTRPTPLSSRHKSNTPPHNKYRERGPGKNV